jgi:hypothetical protein
MTIAIFLTHPPTLQQQFLKNRDTNIDDQPDSFVYLQENGENQNPIWKEFEVTLKDGNGNVKLGPDGKPMITISPPPSDFNDLSSKANYDHSVYHLSTNMGTPFHVIIRKLPNSTNGMEIPSGKMQTDWNMDS